MNIEELKSKCPFLINRERWNKIKSYMTSSSGADDTVTLHAIHLHHLPLIEAEANLLSDQARDCLYPLEDNEYELDGYYIFIDDVNIPDYWKEKVSDVIEVPSIIFDDTFIGTATPIIKKLDLIYIVRWRSLMKCNKCIGIPVIDTLEGIAKDTLGIEDDETVNLTIDRVKELYDDPFFTYLNFSSLLDKSDITLQDIVFYGCPSHDRVLDKEYSYKYKLSNGISIVARVKKLSSDIAIVNFMLDNVEGEDYYLYYNHFLSGYLGKNKPVVSIYDNSTYKIEKNAPDLISEDDAI